MRMRLYRVRAAVAVMLCLCLVFTSLFNVRTASAAMVYVEWESRPGAISSDLTPTFGFTAYDIQTDDYYSGDMECKVDAGPFALCSSPFTTPTLAPGNHTITVRSVDQSGPMPSIDYTWNINQLPTFSGGTSVSGVAGVPIAVTDLQIDDADNDKLSVTLGVPSGVLQLGTTTGITFSGPTTGTTITFSGTRTALNSALTTLTYTPSSAGTITIDATLKGAAGGTRETFNGHAYEIIDSKVNWATAKSLAEGSAFGGVGGYLATVTSTGEEAYLQARMNDGAWIGGSDSSSEGDWRWVTGPENNTLFWSGGSPMNGAYTLWQAGQPDNNGDEDCLELRFNGSESWNDEKCSSLRNYIIEYGTDSALPVLDSTEVSSTALAANGDLDGDGVSNSVEANAPHNGDANDDTIADYTQANVTSNYSSLSGGYIVLQTSCETNQQMQVSAESPSQNDPTYNYPFGLISFTGSTCGTFGDAVTITQYYYSASDPTELTLRKWNSVTGAYGTVNDAALSTVTVGGSQAVKVVYQIVDGGLLDQDGIADGNITDPAGLATIAVGAPNTGLGRQPAADTGSNLLVRGVMTLVPLAMIGLVVLAIRSKRKP